MNKVTLTPELRAKLNGLNEHLEVCDEAGARIGHFLPDSEYRALVSDTVIVIPALTEEEQLQAREDFKRDGGYTTAEVLANLERIKRGLERKS